jgi:hypothetical protein
MEASQHPTPPPAAGTGMWAPYVPPVIGEPLDTLNDVGPFVLVEAQVRPAVPLQFDGQTKMRVPVDLTVATAEPGVTRMFSGFSAGIVGQVERLEPGNLPALVKIVEQEAGRGRTRGLELLQLLGAGADVATIARAQPAAIMPLKGHDPTDPIPY